MPIAAPTGLFVSANPAAAPIASPIILAHFSSFVAVLSTAFPVIVVAKSPAEISAPILGGRALVCSLEPAVQKLKAFSLPNLLPPLRAVAILRLRMPW